MNQVLPSRDVPYFKVTAGSRTDSAREAQLITSVDYMDDHLR